MVLAIRVRRQGIPDILGSLHDTRRWRLHDRQQAGAILNCCQQWRQRVLEGLQGIDSRHGTVTTLKSAASSRVSARQDMPRQLVLSAAADVSVVKLVLRHEGMGLGNVLDKAGVVMIVSDDGTGRRQSPDNALDYGVKAWAQDLDNVQDSNSRQLVLLTDSQAVVKHLVDNLRSGMLPRHSADNRVVNLRHG